MPNGINLRLYNEGDDEKVVDLLGLVFEGWPGYDITCSPLEHWRWKYLNQFSSKPYIALAIDGKKIIGCNLGFPLNISIGGKTHKACYRADTAVHPDYRGKRVSSRMIDFFNDYFTEEGVQLSYWATSNPIIISKGKRSRFPLPFKVTNFVRILNIDKQFKAMPVPHPTLTKTGYLLVKFLNSIGKRLKKINGINKGLETLEIKSFNCKVNELMQKVKANHSFIVEKDQKFLNWRYLNQRAGKFSVKVVRDPHGKGYLGYCIMRINTIREDYPVGFIMELIALPDRLDVIDVLIDQAINFFDRQGVNIINILLPFGHPYQPVLSRKGFLNSRLSPNIFIIILDREIKLDNKSKLPGYFSFGDLDALPSQIPRTSA